MMGLMCKDRDATVYTSDERYCIDNGVMIAYTGSLMYKCKTGIISDFKDSFVTQRYRTDEVPVTWRH